MNGPTDYIINVGCCTRCLSRFRWLLLSDPVTGPDDDDSTLKMMMVKMMMA